MGGGGGGEEQYREDPKGLLRERGVPGGPQRITYRMWGAGRILLDYLENVECREDPIGLLRECGVPGGSHWIT